MTEESIRDLIKAIDKLCEVMGNNKTDYCGSQEALLIIGLSNIRDLKKLNELGVLIRYKRKGSNYLYKKSECIKVAELLDLQKIVI